ncbi:hypothetical protein G6F43_003271 [Rhizopus delemar]|nr:hypothetical protein G6F43_003271 [Rhizopus delemar]
MEVSKPDIEQEHTFTLKKLWKHMGPGWLMSIGYLDPGNLESDLQTGVASGYSLLWLLFWSHVIGLIFQLLAAKLGTVTGKHLAQLIRQHYSPPLANILWAFTQLALIGADMLEMVGTAIALHIFLRCPVWVGVMMTSFDTLTFTMMQRYGMRHLEAIFMVLISLMAICFWLELIQSEPDLGQIVHGLLMPSVPRHAEFQAVAMVGAVVMPHNMFLHSALVASREDKSPRQLKQANLYIALDSALALTVSFLVNLAIVVVFAQVFYQPDHKVELLGLGDADAVLGKTLGFAAKYLWAAGLLAAGQSSTMTGSLAGRYVTEGFFGHVFDKEWHQMAITRALSIVPGMVVALFAVDHFDTMGELLNVLQSICLPTVLIPIIKLCSSYAVLQDFKISFKLQFTCWCLITIVISLDIFLFIQHGQSLGISRIINPAVFVYILFLIYIIWKPLNAAMEDGWIHLARFDVPSSI